MPEYSMFNTPSPDSRIGKRGRLFIQEYSGYKIKNKVPRQNETE